MSLLFDRKYNLTIGTPTTVVYTGETSEIVENGTVDVRDEFVTDYRLTDVNAVEITDLQIEADIKGNSNSSAGANSHTACIKIYNLSDDTRAIIERVNNYVILNAGYAQDPELKMVFTGQVASFETQRHGQNLITILYCKDGYTPVNGMRIAKAYPENTTYGDIFTDIAKIYANNGIPTGLIELGVEDLFRQDYVQFRAPDSTPLINGYSAIGFAHQVLTSLTGAIGYVWYIANGRLFIHPKNYTRVVEQFEFTSDQMKSVRKAASQTSNVSTGKGVDGIVIRTFLDGRLDSDKRIKVLDGQYAGEYKIVAKHHNIDYENGPWDTTVTCTSIQTG